MQILRNYFYSRLAFTALALCALGSSASAQSVISWGSYSFVPSAAQAGVVKIAAQDFARIALKTNGSVVTWSGYTGAVGFGPAAVQSGVTEVAASNHHYLAIKNGGLVIWGGADSGGGETIVPGYASSGVTGIAGGTYHSAALINGEVKVWGYDVGSITQVPLAAQSGVTAIASGREHVIALTSGGGVVAWGVNYQGVTNVPAAALSDVVAITAGNWHNLALKSDGTVVAWGSNYIGESDVPVGLANVQAISAGYDHSMALKTDGSFVGWGSNNGNRTPPVTFHDVTSMTGHTFGSFAVRAPFPAESIVPSNTILCGTVGTATLDLASPAPAGGATVTLTVNDAGVHIPAFVTVPEGDTTATYNVAVDISFGGGRSPKISTIYGGETHKTQFSVSPNSASMTISRSSVVAGSDQTIIATLTLSQSFAVPLTFDVTASAGVDLPATVKVPAGKSVITFKALTTKDIASGSYWDEWEEMYFPYISSIYARYQGNGPGSNFTAVPLQATLTLANSGYAGQILSGLVKLNARPRVTTTVDITSNDPTLSAMTVDVIPGSAGAYFNLYLPIDAPTHQALVAATLNDILSVRPITIIANDLASLTLSSSSVQGPTSVTGTVSVRYPVAVDTVVSLASNKLAASVPSTVTILAGSKSATFTVTTLDVTVDKLVKLSATRNGKTVTATLTVTQ